MADKTSVDPIHAPVEDARTPLGVKLLVLALLSLLGLEIAALIQMFGGG